VVLVAEHSPQAPPGWQAGVDPLQSPSLPQGAQRLVVVLQTGLVPEQRVWFVPVHSTQVLLGTSQAGVAPLQSASRRQPTHTPSAASQTSLAVHRVRLVAEHVPQAPPGWQAGVTPPQSASPEHGAQRFVAPLQAGVAPEHWLRLLAVHCSHV
jgi:hypothetical protein